MHQDIGEIALATGSDERAYLNDSVAAFDTPKAVAPKSGDASAQSSVYEIATNAVQRHPLLAVTAVATVSALVVMALKPSRNPPSRLRSLERSALRQAKLTEQQLKAAIDRSGISGGVEQIAGAVASRLAAIDHTQFEPLRERAMLALNRTLERFAK